MEHLLLRASEHCVSTKTTERRKGLKQLTESLSEANAITLLNKNSLSDQVNWNVLFLSAHRSLVLESEHFQALEAKDKGSASTENFKRQFSSLVHTILKKANISRPQIKFEGIISACFEIFADKYLLKNFGLQYFGFIREDVLPVRVYRKDISYNQWEKLFSIALEFLIENKNETLNTSRKHCAIDMMERVVFYGCHQSPMGILVKNNLLPFLVTEFDNILRESASVEDLLLSLTMSVCSNVAKESRTGVCYLGEVILNSIIKMYDSKCDVSTPRNELVINFLNFQVKCHHPKGVRRGSEAAYACDWSLWNRHLRSMYRLVIGVIQRRDKIMSDSFLDLFIELCNQLFNQENSAYDISISVNESAVGSAAKRRKWTIGIEAVVDELQAGKKDDSSRPWISLTAGILKKYPLLLSNDELYQLLGILFEIQCNCKNSQTMICICNCYEQLLEVMIGRKLSSDLWLKVWETTLRSVGLNQTECHPLLRALMMKKVAPTAGLQSLLRMYMSQMIQLSNQSLQTLRTLLSFYTLPENSDHVSEAHGVAPWELPISAARVTLLNWLFSVLQFANVDIEMLSSVLVMVALKHIPEVEKCKNSSKRNLRDISLEEVYCLSAFDNGLLVPADTTSMHSSSNHGTPAYRNCSSLFDAEALKKLETCLTNIEVELKQRFDELEELTPLRRTKVKFELTNAFVKHACLQANILSCMVSCGALGNESLSSGCIYDSLIRSMALLKILVPDVLENVNTTTTVIVANVENVCQVLESLCMLFGSNLFPSVSLLLREITPSQIVLPVAVFSELPDDNEDEFGDIIGKNSTASNPLQESLVSHVIDVKSLKNVDRIRVICLDILTLYACPKQGTSLSGRQKSVLSQVLKILMNDDIYDLSSTLKFQMIYRTLLSVLSYSDLDPKKHIVVIIQLLEQVYKKWNKDAQASTYFIMLMKDVFKHLSSNSVWAQQCSIILFSRFSNKKFGPNFTVQLISCYEMLLRVDSNSQWARWKDATNFRQIVQVDEIPSEAVRKFEDEKGRVAIVEEVIVFLLSPFHEVRLAAVSCVASLLNGQHRSPLWLQTMFERFSIALCEIFIVKRDKMSHEEKIDESANRTATVLHLLAAVIASNVKFYKQALWLTFRLLKEKNLSSELVKKVLGLLAEPMKLKNMQTFLEKSLPSLLDQWFKWGYRLTEFPHSVMNTISFANFCSNFKEIILPLVFRQKESEELLKTLCEEVQSSPTEILEVSFPAVYAHYLPSLVDKFAKTDSAESALTKSEVLVSLLGSDKIKQLVKTKIGELLIEVTRLVWDSSFHKEMLGLNHGSDQMGLPFISCGNYLSILKYLQGVIGTDLELLLFLGCQKPIILQRVLLQLREDMFAQVTFDQRILSLHQYCVFSYTVAMHIKQGKLKNFEYFLLSDMTHTLLYIINENQSNLVMRDICTAACCYLKMMYEHLLPACDASIKNFLPIIVGSMIPLSLGSGAMAEKSRIFLELLIITHRVPLGHAIGQLPPFPDAQGFDNMALIHKELKYGAKTFTLEDEIKHFLNFEKSTTSFVNHNSIFYGLQFLREQLSERKAELSMLYKCLEVIRGFSQDCKESVLHQLICTLISLLSSEDVKVQLEASRCLGELGPADLTTLVLRPAEGCINMVKGYTEPVMCVMALAACTLSDFLLDRDVFVVKAAGRALHSLLACDGAKRLYGRGNNVNGILLKEKVSPFIPVKNTKGFPVVTGNSDRIISMLCQDDVWCPGEEVQHSTWITKLACDLFVSLSDEHSYFRDLASVCKVKVSFAEEMLPVLFYLGLTYSSDVCHQLCTRLAQFFENHCNVISSKVNSQLSNSSSCSTNVHVNRASVQCMLNVVNFVRLQKNILGDEKISLEVLNYLHIASAAQFCKAYFSSIMYLELWCNNGNRNIEYDCGSGVAYVDYIHEMNPKDGERLQTLLREAYKQIGDDDALYGCGSSIFLNPNTRVNQYEYISKWDKVLLSYDVKLAHSKDVQATNGLAHALYRSGLLHLLNTFLGSLPSDQKNQMYPAQVECMWRLGQWSIPFSPNNAEIEGAFEWKQYSALQSVRDGSKSRVQDFVVEGRLCVLAGLSHASLESCNNIYKPLAQLQALQEIEDFVTSDDIRKVIDKWQAQNNLPLKDIFLVETLVAQRTKLVESLTLQGNQQNNFLLQTQTNLFMETAQLARRENQTKIAEQLLHTLSLMPHLSVDDKHRLQLEEAQLAWNCSSGELDAATKSVARQLLGSLLKDLQVHEKEYRRKSSFHAQALILYGKWMAETQSENPQQIIEDYLEKALNILAKTTASNSLSENLEAHFCLAHFADLEYQRITSYIKSESFQNKVNCMEDLRREGNQLQKDEKKTDESVRAARLNLRCSTIDAEEIKHNYDDQKHFIELALRHYLMSLKLGEGESLPVFRMVSLWLENTSLETVNQLVSPLLENIQTHKFVLLLPQLAAHLGDNMQDPFNEALYSLLFRCCLDHPHHTLPLILALANSYEDPDTKVKPKLEARVIGAKHMLLQVKKNKTVRDILMEMEKISSALISLAYLPIAGKNNDGYAIPKGEKVRQISNFYHAMLPIISLPVQSDKKYDNITSIHSFEAKYSLTGGITRPKKIMCLGTDGIQRPLLVKGKDDLRQDAVMQQVFAIMNTLLQACKETKSQRLSIRVYKVVPLSRKSGVLEWCQNTSPLQIVLPEIHSKYYPQDIDGLVCRKMIEKAKSKSNAERLQAYKEVCKKFHPAFRFFFVEKFPTPAEWFDHRLAYVRSVATSSMVGFILGLGDRHVSNILIDNNTAELIHIDFGIAFEQGRLLPTPETVPFRLSRDIVDGMGVSGVEGVFRRSCEKTIAVLRRNQEKIITILEVLLYDPLCDWTVTSKKAAKLQRGHNSQASMSSALDGGNESSKEKNKMAERALSRLQKKLQGTEEGPASSVEGQVNRLIQQARNPANLCLLFAGWQAYY